MNFNEVISKLTNTTTLEKVVTSDMGKPRKMPKWH